MRLELLARTSAAVAATPARSAKVALLANVLRPLGPGDASIAAAYLSGDLPQGAVGIGPASLRDLPAPAGRASLELTEVEAALERIRAATGPGSRGLRERELRDLFERATAGEREFLIRLLLGDLAQGALQGVVADAVAAASGASPRDVRRAVMLAGSLGPVAAAAIGRGPGELARFRLRLLAPIRPMLAQTADDLGEAMARIRPAAIEWKLDGARIQVHRSGSEIRVFTRNLAEVTDRVPEIVDAVAELSVASILLDGEAVALRSDGRPQPFQVTMARFGARRDVDRLAAVTPLSAFFFDCLHLDGDDLIDRPASERAEALARAVPERLRVPRLVTADLDAAGRFLEDALARGHEGVMVKALGAGYEAGRRGGAWLKVKRAHTLDLVVLAAEWGHGRRRGLLSNLHLGARDPAGGFVMLGKTFKGLTDQMLDWQTRRLLELETSRDRHTVHVRPVLVVEVAFDGVQTSPRYPGGVALRFARVKGYRPDKDPSEADTIEAVRAIRDGPAGRTRARPATPEVPQ